MLTAVRSLILFSLSASGGVLLKSKQSFFRRISPIFLAAVVLVSSLCFAAPVSAADFELSSDDWVTIRELDKLTTLDRKFIDEVPQLLPIDVDFVDVDLSPFLGDSFEGSFQEFMSLAFSFPVCATDFFPLEFNVSYLVSLSDDECFVPAACFEDFFLL